MTAGREARWIKTKRFWHMATASWGIRECIRPAAAMNAIETRCYRSGFPQAVKKSGFWLKSRRNSSLLPFPPSNPTEMFQIWLHCRTVKLQVFIINSATLRRNERLRWKSWAMLWLHLRKSARRFWGQAGVFNDQHKSLRFVVENQIYSRVSKPS